MSVLFNIKKSAKYMIYSFKWRKNNKKNFTTLSFNSSYDIDSVKVGIGTYGNISFETFYDTKARLFIGNYCSIGPNVKFLLAGEHNYKNVSTYPFKFKYIKKECETFSRGDIYIGDDVWIGYGVTILSGVHIGQGAVIGAGEIVRKNVPPYAIFCNGRVEKFRFDKELRTKLSKIDYSKISSNINKYYKYMYLNPYDFVNSEIYKKIIKDVK